jgi:hypothetical protein
MKTVNKALSIVIILFVFTSILMTAVTAEEINIQNPALIADNLVADIPAPEAVPAAQPEVRRR